MPRLLEAGALDLGWLEVRGEPVAAFYNFRWKGKLSFYQSGRRLDVPEDVRVGVAMHAYLLRGAIADGLREYDFLAGASQYKQTFALAERPLVRLRVARSSWLERARRAGERGLDQARRLRERARRELPSRTPRVLRPLLVKVLGEPPPPP
jgi:CelD/BcsL family acetyltransferase involved in cellulose biosynthesis